MDNGTGIRRANCRLRSFRELRARACESSVSLLIDSFTIALLLAIDGPPSRYTGRDFKEVVKNPTRGTVAVLPSPNTSQATPARGPHEKGASRITIRLPRRGGLREHAVGDRPGPGTVLPAYACADYRPVADFGSLAGWRSRTVVAGDPIGETVWPVQSRGLRGAPTVGVARGVQSSLSIPRLVCVTRSRSRALSRFDASSCLARSRPSANARFSASMRLPIRVVRAAE